MKSIHTLIPDIYSIVKTKGWFTDELATDFGINVANRLKGQFAERDARATLRLSQMGPRCPCALWNSINHPELAEALPPWASIKYSYGHMVEALAIALTKAAGHTVTGEQDELEVDGIIGHRDCVIDGVTVDVKSSSSRSFNKFRTGEIAKDDTFGYLDQLDGYVLGAANDPLVLVKDKGYLLVIDKTLGHICLYRHEVSHERAILLRERISRYKSIVGLERAPDCECRTVAQGSSGNIQLDVKAGYSAYKHCCFPNLRTFIYANGPAYLTKVVRKPDVVEVNKDGRQVYA